MENISFDSPFRDLYNDATFLTIDYIIGLLSYCKNRNKERLIKAKEYPEKHEDIEDATKDIAYMQKDAELKQAWEKQMQGLVTKKNRKQEILDIWRDEERSRRRQTPPLPSGAPSNSFC